VPGMLGRR